MTKNKQPKYSLTGFWQRLWALLTPSQRELKGLLILVIIAELSQFAGPYLLKRVIDLIAHFRIEELTELGMFVAAVFVADQTTSMLQFLSDRRIFKILVDAEAYLPTRAQEKMVFLGLAYHEKENTGNKISKIQRGVDKVVNLLGNMCWDVVPTSIQIIFTTLILLIVNWRFAMIFLFFVPLFALITLKLNRDVYPFRRRRHDKYEEAAGQMAQAIININTVKSFVQERREVREFGVIRDDIKKNSLFEFFKLLNFNLGRNLVIDLGRISTLALGVYLVWQSSITIGSLVFVFTISEKAFLSLYRISRLYDRIMESSEAVDRLSELTQELSEVANSGRFKPEKYITHRLPLSDGAG